MVAVDFGSTYTKLALVDVQAGRIAGLHEEPTTAATDIWRGFELGRASLERRFPWLVIDEMYACSSAGGGLRVAVVGLEPDLTARAGRLAAMSAGARVVDVLAGTVDAQTAQRLARAAPDIVLLTGGFDGGDREHLIASAEVLRDTRISVPVVVAGNADASDDAVARLAETGVAVRADNVMPAPGKITVGAARTQIRSMFIEHVIGGKNLSSDPRFAAAVQMATPDATLLGLESLVEAWTARGFSADVLAVDVGGATTDVHTHVRVPRSDQPLHVNLTPEDASSRTVEGDLGIRWTASSLIMAAHASPTHAGEVTEELRDAAMVRACIPAFVARDELEAERDLELTELATSLAIHRHAGTMTIRVGPAGAVVASQGKDLGNVTVIIGTGGVFRHADGRTTAGILSRAYRPADPRTRRLLPKHPSTFLADRSHALTAAGLLTTAEPGTARRIIEHAFPPPAPHPTPPP